MGLRGPISISEQLVNQSNRSTTPRALKRKPSAPRRNPPSSSKPRHVAPSHDDNVIMKPPKHLTPATRAWWKSITDVFELEAHQFRTLQIAAEALDRREEARAALRKHGLVYTDDKGMVRQRPEIAIEREMSTSFLRCIRALKLEGLES